MTAPFQHTDLAKIRFAKAGYQDAHQRRDCCARCDNCRMRGRNPFCDLHKIFVQKMGNCAKNSNTIVKDDWLEKALALREG